MPQDSPKLWPSFIQGKCPRCRSGNVFKHSLYHITKFSGTHSHCPSCELKFEPEPGFYWGAMYVSFAFSTGLLLITALLSISYEWSLTKTLLIAPVVALICLPFIFRYSRLIMLYFISPATHRFKPDLGDKKKSK